MSSIFKRVSVRSFQEKAVEAEKVEMLLKAAMAAPSAGNQQPWEFYVTDDKAILDKLAQTSPYAGCTKLAPMAIVPCYRKEGLMFPEFAQIDLSIACENILLEATELGLGGVWLAVAPLQDRMDAAREVLNLPEKLEPFAIIPIGYPTKESKQQDRFDQTRIHYVK